MIMVSTPNNYFVFSLVASALPLPIYSEENTWAKEGDVVAVSSGMRRIMLLTKPLWLGLQI